MVLPDDELLCPLNDSASGAAPDPVLTPSWAVGGAEAGLFAVTVDCDVVLPELLETVNAAVKIPARV
jgi:hypothetical protein